MPAVIIDGKAAAAKVRAEAAQKAAQLKAKGVIPCLAVVLVGDDPASVSYVTAKEKALEEAGMRSRDIRLSGDTGESALLDIIAALNADRAVHGILVQLPLPSPLDEDRVIGAVSAAKDVDGLLPLSAGNLALDLPGFIPCTPHGILVLLREMNIPTNGAHAVIVGRSKLVGRPLANLLTRRAVNATVTVCHTGTRDMAFHTRQADILIAAAGSPHLITADMVKEGAAVIDVGVNRVEKRLRGDVDFDAVAAKASYITPVPGGVGPMTIAMLLCNVVQAAEHAKAKSHG
ncbi:MAG: bifunctional 5,10-methylene-tetrahydrofolate dehydrogenase/5,10-methylene-tetrahydrofolate cyclohydrolase [Treponema sp.]|jgi:methylenetetrahydrofolate dehydrogenase (NADP+)/methenyltetrahydrofolate cyclohydrolase|nr:bifunctional 5,10-methylene-tetrahydrofolate dehydrogenase/5,10-methylene-tetrahydrofolate cyclohydrolase [Treponema sp.]